MTADSINRKLTAILSADAKGYSRLMGKDEVGTVKLLKEYREIMAQLILQDRGRVVDSPGDNLLAEFGSVVDAAGCAVKIQEQLKTKNAKLSEEKRLEFRIGINLGDVLEDGDRLYGDGVNIAARIEGLAEPGGICISRTAYDHVKNKLELGYEYLGEQNVKNISDPVRVYRVLVEPEAAGKVIGEKRFLGRISRNSAIAAIIILLIVAGGLIGWNIYLQQAKKIEPASLDKMAYPLPEKPSIVVLPFDNLSGDSDQEYLSDGITEHIITSLSKMPELFVIARNTAFNFKGKAVNIRQVSEELGVRYILEGSVQKSGNRVRIEAQLIDALKGHHLWAESYDKILEGLFVLQDDITLSILKALQVRMTVTHDEFGIGTDNLEAYLKLLQAIHHAWRWNKDDMAFARRLYIEAIASDPEYAEAYTRLGWTHYHDVYLGWSKTPKNSLMRAEELAQKSISLNNSLPSAHSLIACIYLLKRQYEKAIAEGERAVALNPNSALINVLFGWILSNAGKREEAILLYKKALRLNPYPPTWYLSHLGQAYFLEGRYDEAVAVLTKATHRNPDIFYFYIDLAAAYILLGHEEEARAAAAEILRLNPKFSPEWVEKTALFKDQADKKHVINALRKAGLK